MTLETGSTAVCDRCRRHFSPRRCDARFCSAACKQAAYRLRLEAAEEGAKRAAEAARKAAEAAAEATRRAVEVAKRRADFIASVRSRFGVRIQFEQNQCFTLSHFS